MIETNKLNEYSRKILEVISSSNDPILLDLKQWLLNFKTKDNGFHKSKTVKMFIGADMNDGYGLGKLIPAIKVEEGPEKVRITCMLHRDGRQKSEDLRILTVDGKVAVFMEKQNEDSQIYSFKVNGNKISKIKEISKTKTKDY